MSITDKELEVVEEFEMFDDWMEKYEHLIELGKELNVITEQNKVDVNLIKGCQSRVWVHAEMIDGKVVFSADSDAIITRGIIALLIRVLGNETPEAILHADLGFVDKIGLKDHLSPTRANGLVGMIKQIKAYALSFMAKS